MINTLSVSHGPEAQRDARATTAVQRSLPLRVQLRLPMVDIAAVRAALGVNEDEVLDLIEDGQLAWAWDISTKGTGKAEMRIFARSVSAYQNAQGGLRSVANEFTFDEVVHFVFGLSRPWLWGREIARAFNCSSEHVLNLVREGSLKLLPGHMVPNGKPFRQDAGTLGWRRGPGGSPCVAYESVLRFLKARRKGGLYET